MASTSRMVLASFFAGATFILWRRLRSTEGGEEEEWEPVDRDHVVKFFQVINQKSHTNMATFNQQIAQYRGKVPEQQLTDLAVGHFEDQLAKNQEQVLAEMRIPVEDMEDASKYYQAEGDPQVTEQMKMLKNIYLAVSGSPTEQEEVELPDDLTAEKMVTVMTAFFKASNDVIKTVVQEYLANGENLSNPQTAFKMSQAIQEKSGPATNEAIKRFNLDSTTIGPAMEKFRDHPGIQMAVAAGTEEQHSILQEYGLA